MKEYSIDDFSIENFQGKVLRWVHYIPQDEIIELGFDDGSILLHNFHSIKASVIIDDEFQLSLNI